MGARGGRQNLARAIGGWALLWPPLGLLLYAAGAAALGGRPWRAPAPLLVVAWLDFAPAAMLAGALWALLGGRPGAAGARPPPRLRGLLEGAALGPSAFLVGLAALAWLTDGEGPPSGESLLSALLPSPSLRDGLTGAYLAAAGAGAGVGWVLARPTGGEASAASAGAGRGGRAAGS